MTRQIVTNRHNFLNTGSASAEAIGHSLWNSFQRLTELQDPTTLDRHLEGYDIGLQVVEALYGGWNEQSVPPGAVTIARCDRYTRRRIGDALSEIFEALRFEEKLRTVHSVFIKLGLIQAVEWSEHVTTVPIFLDVLIAMLRDIRPEIQIRIGDGSGHERDSDLLLRKSGIAPVLKKHKDVRFVDLNMDDLGVVVVPDPATLAQLALPRSLLDADLVISLAKLKTHKWTGVSLGLKNMFGALPGSVYGFPKNRLHWACYPRAICDIWSAIAPEFVLIDGIVGIEGSGPLNGDRVGSGILIAGYDPVATDGTAAQLMGISPHMLPTFWFAALKNLGYLGPTALRDELRPFTKTFRPPPNKEWLFASVYKSDEEQLAIIRSLLL